MINQNMKQIFTAIFASLFIAAFSQTQKEVEDGIFVTFPTAVEYKANTQATTYIGKTKNCLFMSVVMRNAIPNYAQFVQAKKKWTKAEIKKVEDSFLDGAVKGTFDYTGNKGRVTEIKIGKFSGRKVEYSAINPATGERAKVFTIMLLVRDRVVDFECWYLKDNASSRIEKDNFLNSIKIKINMPTPEEIKKRLTKARKEYDEYEKEHPSYITPSGEYDYAQIRPTTEGIMPTGKYKKLYDEGIISGFEDPAIWDIEGLKHQTGWGVTAKMFKGMVYKAVSGVLDVFGSDEAKSYAEKAEENAFIFDDGSF